MIDSRTYQEAFRAGEAAALAAADDLTLWSAPFGLALLETAKLLPGMQVLDLGCGMGFPLLELAARLGPRGQVTGLDPWKPALERAEAKAKLRGLANLELVEGIGRGHALRGPALRPDRLQQRPEQCAGSASGPFRSAPASPGPGPSWC